MRRPGSASGVVSTRQGWHGAHHPIQHQPTHSGGVAIGKPLASGCDAQYDEGRGHHTPNHARRDEDYARRALGGPRDQLAHPPDAMRTTRGACSVGSATSSPTPPMQTNTPVRKARTIPTHPTQLLNRTRIAMRTKPTAGANGAEIAVPRDSSS